MAALLYQRPRLATSGRRCRAKIALAMRRAFFMKCDQAGVAELVDALDSKDYRVSGLGATQKADVRRSCKTLAGVAESVDATASKAVLRKEV